ncbi:alkaline phosphatase [Arthrobacter crystallopoietes BAB-32]|uniref:Alkaline phosphatase n=1 Tax=Arthrobacter crystallopoietes BAB-32 TaxID=1246476 RepID=N1UWE0_9MICC|nr:alkaline phosphatase D family protein [Arthrobacter crystallopoietes]EMY34706.1 alkaline phosphatase [Arthrobacter crystallopoietes BAB-32]
MTASRSFPPPGPSGTVLPRRQLLRSAGVFAAAATLPGLLATGTPAQAAAAGFFRHGVASGDPYPHSVLLWTRLTPADSAMPGSGAGADSRVRWEVSRNADFTGLVGQGWAETGAWRDHTVKVVAAGLEPATTYWYRFRFGQEYSSVGRTRTAPAAGAAVDRLRMGVVSCANYQAGYFAAYRHLADRGDLDLVLHLGDYLYEYAPGEYQARDVVVRAQDPAVEMTTLAHYRRRHAQYKSDPDLQALHAAAPFVVTWDDHESANDAWSGGAQNHTEPAEGTWQERSGFAQQAYAEWMPVRYEPGGQLYRRLEFGSLASLSMLDLRSYRSQQADSQLAPAIDDPDRTITGAEQMDWLLAGLSNDAPQWKLVGNPVMITPVRFPSTLNTQEMHALSELLGDRNIDGVPYNVDQWDGYVADRNQVLRHLRDNAVTDTVFLTGDIHSGWACDLPVDPLTYPLNGRSAATELVCTSVTSDNLDDILRVPERTASLTVESGIRTLNPHVKYLDFDSHGFSVLEVTPAEVRMDWYRLADRTDPASATSRTASWTVAAGTQKVRPASGGILS